MPVYFVYIIYSETANKYYVGHTINLELRLQQHIIRKNLGANDWIVKYTEPFPSRAEAMKREKEIKSKKKRAYIEEMINS